MKDESLVSIPEVEIGIPDIDFIKRMSKKQLKAWIQSRLKDCMGRDESRLSIFIWLFENLGNDDMFFIRYFQGVLGDLIKVFGWWADTIIDYSKIKISKRKEEYVTDLVDLIGYFYAILGEKGIELKDGNSHDIIENSVSEMVWGLRIREMVPEYKDLTLRLLYTLGEGEMVCGSHIAWEIIFRCDDGVFAAAAMMAFVDNDIKKAIGFLPEFLETHKRLPDDVSMDEVLFTLFESADMSFDEKKDLIIKAFDGKEKELAEIDDRLIALGCKFWV